MTGNLIIPPEAVNGEVQWMATSEVTTDGTVTTCDQAILFPRWATSSSPFFDPDHFGVTREPLGPLEVCARV